MKKILLAITLLLSFLVAQSSEAPTVKVDKVAQTIANSTGFSPQNSTIFTFLGVSPSMIQRPSLIREMSLGGGLAGAQNLALGFELQPLWLLGCKHITFDEYAKIPGVFRNLMNLYAGVGFIQNGPNLAVGYSVKIPLLYKDPMNDKKYMERMTFPFTDRERYVAREIQKIDLAIYKGGLTKAQEAELIIKRKELNGMLEMDDAKLKADALTYKANYEASNWNAAQINLIFAQGLDVNTADPFSIKRQYLAGYLVANQPLTKYGILNEMFRAHYEIVNSTITNTNTYFEYGINLTFGAPAASFYVEGVGKGFVTNMFANITAGFGGHFVPSTKFSFDLGLRLTFDYKANLINLYPAANASFRI